MYRTVCVVKEHVPFSGRFAKHIYKNFGKKIIFVSDKIEKGAWNERISRARCFQCRRARFHNIRIKKLILDHERNYERLYVM